MKEVTTKVTLIEEAYKKHENMLANASVTIKGENSDSITITGFIVWKSKHEGYNVTYPQKRNFKYILTSPTFKEKLDKIIIDEYEKISIPVI